MFELLELIQAALDWLFVGIYDFVTEVFAIGVEWVVVAMIQLKIWLAQFAWDVAENIIANIGLSSLINSAWGSIDSKTLGYLTFFRLPEALNIVIQALVARFTLGVMS